MGARDERKAARRRLVRAPQRALDLLARQGAAALRANGLEARWATCRGGLGRVLTRELEHVEQAGC
jgi:hypothetical protein